MQETFTGALIAKCGNCRIGRLTPTGKPFRLAEILHRWEAQRARPFSPLVWNDYRKNNDQFIAVHACDRCGIHYFLPIVIGTEQFYREVTETSYYVEAKWEFRRAVRDLRRQKRSRTLDVGCGTGEFLAYLRAQTGLSGTGFDFNDSLLPALCERGFAGLESLDDPAAAARFDSITLFQVIEHVADHHALFDRLDRLLAPGGFYIAAVPDREGPVRFFQDAVTDTPPHHVTRWSRNAVLGLAQTRGYGIRYLTTEWLPRYLWGMYLPLILDNAGLPFGLAGRLNRSGATQAFVRLASATYLQELPGVRGHSLYAVFEQASAPC